MTMISSHSDQIPKKQINLIFMGVIFSLFYWIMESVQDVVGLDKGSIIERLFYPDSKSCWMRLLVVFLLIGFGAIAQVLTKRIEVSKEKSERQFHTGRMIWAGLGFSALYWILGAVHDTVTFGKGSFFDCLILPNEIDIAMRMLAICIIVLFSTYAQVLIDDRQKAEKTLKKTQEQLAVLVNERTKALSKSNELLKKEIQERSRAEQQLIKVNRTLKTLSKCKAALVRATDESALLDNVCKKLVETGGYPLVWIDLIKQNGKSHFDLISQAALNKQDLALLDCFHTQKKVNCHTFLNKAIQSEEPVIVNDLSEVEIGSEMVKQLIKSGYSTLISIPLVKKNQAFGILNILGNKNCSIDQEDVKFLRELANDLAFGIDVLNTRNEHEKAEKEKEQMRAQLLQSQKMEAIGILAGGVAHDFNNLLTAIQVSVDLAMMATDENSLVHRELDEIHQVALHASDLAKQLLLFSRRHPMEPAPLDLNVVVEHLNKMLKRLISENITISLEIDSRLWHIWADRATIEQVIMNLIVNARDAMENGGEIYIRAQNVRLNKTRCRQIPESRPGKYVKLTIEDTGNGMPKDVVQHIFEPFFSTKSPGKGTGLGLSVVYGIVKEHEGFVKVSSEVGTGTAFEIYLPAITLRPEPKENTSISFNRFQGRGKGILIIEDEEKVRDSTGKGLQMNGYTVFTASTGSEAEQMFNREKGAIDVIFSDVVLPDTSGIVLTEKLKEINSNLKILMCSGYADEHIGSLEFQNKNFLFLQKPYTLSEVLKKLQTLMNA